MAEANTSEEKLTRAELEARLKSKGDQISGRFERLESKIPSKVPTFLGMIKSNPSIKVGAAIGAGLLVGLLLFRNRSKGSGVKYHEGLDELTDQIAKRIANSLEKGNSSSEAVREAFEKQPPIMNLSKEAEGVISGAFRQLVQTGVSVAGSELANYLRNRQPDESSAAEKADN